MAFALLGQHANLWYRVFRPNLLSTESVILPVRVHAPCIVDGGGGPASISAACVDRGGVAPGGAAVEPMAERRGASSEQWPLLATLARAHDETDEIGLCGPSMHGRLYKTARIGGDRLPRFFVLNASECCAPYSARTPQRMNRDATFKAAQCRFDCVAVLPSPSSISSAAQDGAARLCCC